jgi:NADH:ubiquinone oxidoreductase subunit 4 (subunit M)
LERLNSEIEELENQKQFSDKLSGKLAKIIVVGLEGILIFFICYLALYDSIMAYALDNFGEVARGLLRTFATAFIFICTSLGLYGLTPLKLTDWFAEKLSIGIRRFLSE